MYIPFEFETGETRIIHYIPETYELKNLQTMEKQSVINLPGAMF